MWTYKQFLDYLKIAGCDLPLAPPQAFPDAIDFGLMANLTRQMSQQTAADSYHRERMRRIRVCVTLAAETQPDELRVQLDAHDTIGSNRRVQAEAKRSVAISESAGLQMTHHVGLIHTHPNDCPFSPQDCSNLLHHPREGRMVVMLLGTTQGFMAMLISQSTPVLAPDLRERLTTAETTLVSINTAANAMAHLLRWCQYFAVGLYSVPWRRRATVADRILA